MKRETRSPFHFFDRDYLINGLKMKELRLCDGYYAMVDDEDIDMLDKFSWHRRSNKYTSYAMGAIKINGKFKCIFMHRLIMNCPNNMVVDHIDGNGLNNQKDNLRICTLGENLRNAKKHTGLLQYKGVVINRYMTKKYGLRIRYIASLVLHGRRIKLGNYDTERGAAKAYDRGAVLYFGEFARLNFQKKR
jgi:hypothetical protein